MTVKSNVAIVSDISAFELDFSNYWAATKSRKFRLFKKSFYTLIFKGDLGNMTIICHEESLRDGIFLKFSNYLESKNN